MIHWACDHLLWVFPNSALASKETTCTLGTTVKRHFALCFVLKTFQLIAVAVSCQCQRTRITVRLDHQANFLPSSLHTAIYYYSLSFLLLSLSEKSLMKQISKCGFRIGHVEGFWIDNGCKSIFNLVIEIESTLNEHLICARKWSMSIVPFQWQILSWHAWI